MPSALNPKRTLDELKALRALTTNPATNGAMRVAWTDTWLESRAWLRKQVADLPLEIHDDEAGNTWFTLKGKSKKALLIGGHMDSVPDGGWLDGCLNVLAGLEVLRRIHAEYNGAPPVTVRVVDWADEEGARFGRSLLGSSACAGTMDPAIERNRVDKQGITLEAALKRCGVDIDKAHKSGKELKNAAAYLELHIEQGPVLERRKAAAWHRARHLRRRALGDQVCRPDRPLRQHADGCAARRAGLRRPARAGNPRRSAKSTAVCARSAASSQSPAS